MSGVAGRSGRKAFVPNPAQRDMVRKLTGWGKEPPVGLSRDLMIRIFANQIQERAHGGPSRSLKRRLHTLAGEVEKGSLSLDPGVVLKTGARLVRQWGGHTHSVLVVEDGFEYEGQRYLSLTMIAARITGAHWSGPRFFGVTKRTSGSLSTAAETGHE